jgi:subtilisin family serine protease
MPIKLSVAHMVFTNNLLREIQNPKNFQTIPVIVELNPDSKVSIMSSQISQALGVDIVQVIPFVNSFSIVIPTGMLGELSSFKDIKTIHYDRPLYGFSPPLPLPPDPLAILKGGPEGMTKKISDLISNPDVMVSVNTGWIPTSEANKATRLYELHKRGILGQGVKVWVLDTGVDISNPQLQGVIAGAHSSTAGAPNDMNGHGCLTPDAKVFTSFCGMEELGKLFENAAKERSPEHAGEGEAVFFDRPIYTIGSLDGHSIRSRVKAVYRMKYDGELIIVKMGPVTLKMTPWHKVLVVDRRSNIPKYVRADRLSEYNINCILPNTPINLTDAPGCGLGPDNAYLIGLFIGDGCLPKTGTEARISMGDSDPTPIENLLDRLEYNHWRQGKKSGGHPNIDLGIGLRFRNLLLSIGFITGNKTLTVRIPKKILIESSTEEKAAILAGLIDSDGHFDKSRRRTRIVTTSPRLADDIIALTASLGITAKKYSQEPIGKSKHTCWSIHIKSKAMDIMLNTISKHLRIRSPPKTPNSNRDQSAIHISKEQYNGWLYDLTTETKNYMVGNNGMIFVHNSWCASRIVGQLYTHPIHGFDLLGGAPECELYTCKVLTDLGFGNTSDILKGMQMALDNQADIISMSLGGEGDAEGEEEDLMTKFINKAAETNPKTIFVIAAGNSGAEGEKAGKTIGIPANAEEAISVGAWSILDRARSYYSSTGPTLQAGRIKPDIVADGGGRAIATGYKRGMGDIFSGSAFGSQLDPLDKLVDGFTVLKGTSMATPCVAAILALWKQLVPELTARDVKAIFAKFGQQKNTEMGWGLIQADWILQAMAEQ